MISDDAEATEILLRLGVLDKMRDPLSFPEGKAAFLGHKQHPTHWVLGCRFSGCENPADNGFVVFGWPKKDFPAEVMKIHVKEYFEGSGGYIAHTRSFKHDDQKN